MIKYVFLFILFSVFLYGEPNERGLIGKILNFENINECYFTFANSIIIKDDQLFVLENWKHRVLIFKLGSNSIKFVKNIGKKGQGPGDLNLPAHISIDGNKISIKDEEGVSLFSLDGKFLFKFRTFSGTISDFYSKDVYFTLTANPNLKNLILLFSHNGKRLAEIFPKYLEIDYSKNKYVSPIFLEKYFYKGKIFPYSNRIYYLNIVFGTLFKLDHSGNLLASLSLDSALNKNAVLDIIKNNELLHEGLDTEFPDSGGLRVKLLTICSDAYLFKNKLFLLDHPYHSETLTDTNGKEIKKICIRSFDIEKMRADDVFEFDISNDEKYLQSFAVSEDKDGMFFLIVREIGDGPVFVKYPIKRK